MRTIAEVLRWRSQRHPELPAIRYDGQEISYADLNRKTNRLALGLIHELGLRPGDRVAILDKNCAAYLELLFALDKAGVVAAPINWRLTPTEVNQILEDIEPRILVVGEEFRSHGDSAEVKTLSFEEIPQIEGNDPGRDKDGTISWQFATSGTTGLPKGAMLTGHNVLNVGLCLALEMPELREGGPSLVCMPMFHLGGAGWAVWAMQEGATLVIVREIDPSNLLQIIVREKIETALLVPAVMLFLTETPGVRQADFSKFKHVVYGTAPIAPDLLERCIDIFECRFTQIYGLTETAGPFAALPFEHHKGDRLLSCGRPMFGGRARVIDENGKELPPGEIGEIVYQGENLMAGYWNRPEATEDVIRDGWFHTGDAGTVDEEGFFYVKDRIKDMIVTGSENVYPAEVEASLAAHPDIIEIAVIGVPDDRWGEKVKAIAVRRSGSSLSEQELLTWAGERLAGYKRPRSVDFVEQLPRNASGKILKRALREPYWQGRNRAVN
ncbi:MAG: AMP-binding protein [Rhodospirillales bacterium]|jgi:long-chain acyl-CoA synthetase